MQNRCGISKGRQLWRFYERDDEEMMKIWRTGVEETRTLLTEKWVESGPTIGTALQDASAYDGQMMDKF